MRDASLMKSAVAMRGNTVMKSRSSLLCVLVIISINLASLVRAQVPGIINYQGRASVNGTNFDGTGQFQFALVNGPLGTTTYWSNGTSTVSLPVTKGLYSVLLGDTTVSNMLAIPSTVFANSDVRLRVWFNGGAGLQQLTPDQRLAAVGYAMMAANVPAGAIGTAQLASNAVTTANIATGAVTTAAIADGAVGADQLASNAITPAILASAGVLTNVTSQYWATNQYYLIASFASTNRISTHDWADMTYLFLTTSTDGTNVTFVNTSGYVPSGAGSGIGLGNVNDPTLWSANGALFYTYTPEPDIPTNSMSIYSATNLQAPNIITTIDFSSLALSGNLSNLWILMPQIDATPNIIPTNIFVSVSTNNLASQEIYILTCVNAPTYTLWTTPSRVPISGAGVPMTALDPLGFSYHGTNMLMVTSFAPDSILIATNATSPGSGYAVWKGMNWGGWTNATVTAVAPLSVVFLPDRIRLYMEAQYAAITNGCPGRFAYSDCFDDWNTWTPVQQVNGPNTGIVTYNGLTSNVFLRSCSVLPVPGTNVLNAALESRLGLTQPPIATEGLTVTGSASIGGSTTISGNWTFNGQEVIFGGNSPAAFDGGIEFGKAQLITNATTLVTSNNLNMVDSSAGAFSITLGTIPGSFWAFVLTNANPAPVTILPFGPRVILGPSVLSNQNEVLLAFMFRSGPPIQQGRYGTIDPVATANSAVQNPPSYTVLSTTAPTINQVRTNGTHKLQVYAMVELSPNGDDQAAELYGALNGVTNHYGRVEINDGNSVFMGGTSFSLQITGPVNPGATYWITNFNGTASIDSLSYDEVIP
jgi:hypothetical protein